MPACPPKRARVCLFYFYSVQCGWAIALGYLHTAQQLRQAPRNIPGKFPEASGRAWRGRCGGRGRVHREGQGGCTGCKSWLAAGWYYLARSLTAASTATSPSGLEFETRDGSHSGAVATGRHSLDGAKTVGLCSLPEMPCALLLLLALPQGSNPAHIAPPAAHSRPTLAVTAAPGDGISPRHRLGRKCSLHGSCHHTEAPCLACCIAPASTSHARVLQLSVDCSGPFKGVQARDCNLLQMG